MGDELPLATLLAGPPPESEFHLQLLRYQAPPVQLQAFVEGLESAVLGLAPRTPLRKFIVRHRL